LIERGFFGHNLFYTLSKAQRDLNTSIYLNKRKKGESFVIIVSNEVLGEIRYDDLIPNLKAKRGYWLGEEFRGSGIMIKALKLTNSYIFKKDNLKRIYASVRYDNLLSMKVLEKLGFKLEEVQKKSLLKKGKFYDECLYAKVK